MLHEQNPISDPNLNLDKGTRVTPRVQIRIRIRVLGLAYKSRLGSGSRVLNALPVTRVVFGTESEVSYLLHEQLDLLLVGYEENAVTSFFKPKFPNL